MVVLGDDEVLLFVWVVAEDILRGRPEREYWRSKS